MPPAIKKEIWDKFFNALEEWPNVSKACKVASIGRSIVYLNCRTDEEFKKRFDEARGVGVEAVEDFAFDQTKVSDTMAIFMLKCNKPEKYADRKEINLGGNVTVALNMVFDDKKD